LPRFIEEPISSQESEWSCLCGWVGYGV